MSAPTESLCDPSQVPSSSSEPTLFPSSTSAAYRSYLASNPRYPSTFVKSFNLQPTVPGDPTFLHDLHLADDIFSDNNPDLSFNIGYTDRDKRHVSILPHVRVQKVPEAELVVPDSPLPHTQASEATQMDLVHASSTNTVRTTESVASLITPSVSSPIMEHAIPKLSQPAAATNTDLQDTKRPTSTVVELLRQAGLSDHTFDFSHGVRDLEEELPTLDLRLQELRTSSGLMNEYIVADDNTASPSPPLSAGTFGPSSPPDDRGAQPALFTRDFEDDEGYAESVQNETGLADAHEVGPSSEIVHGVGPLSPQVTTRPVVRRQITEDTLQTDSALSLPLAPLAYTHASSSTLDYEGVRTGKQATAGDDAAEALANMSWELVQSVPPEWMNSMPARSRSIFSWCAKPKNHT